MLRQFTVVLLVTSVGVLGLSACSKTIKPDEPQASGRVQPIDSFEKVGEPHRAYPNVRGNEPSNLSTDVERLQDARRQYNNDRAREAAEHRRSQAECRKAPDSKKVPIEDGSGTSGEYCQNKTQEPADDQKE